MTTQDVIGILAAGAPDAIIILRPKDLEGLIGKTLEVCDADTIDAYVRRSPLPQRKRRLSKGEIFNSIRHYWPKASVAKLADALGVTRQAVYKAMTQSEHQVEDRSTGTEQPQPSTAPHDEKRNDEPESEPAQEPEQRQQYYHFNFSNDDKYGES